MTHDKAVECLEQLENSLVRAESSMKDRDLLISLRILYWMMKDIVKETEDKK